jgi:hypothetical protein
MKLSRMSREGCIRKRRAAVSVLAMVLTATGFAGCDSFAGFIPVPAGVTQIEDVYAKLPAAASLAKSILPGSIGPPGSLFGVLLDDNTRAFAIGTIAPDGTMTITGVALFDPDGNFILQEDFRQDGMKLTFPSGDSIDVDGTGLIMFTLTLNATSPPSVIKLQLLDNGEVEVVDSDTTFEDAQNPSYDDGSRRKLWDGAERLKTPAVSADTTCAQVGNAIVFYVGVACDIKGFITKNAPEFVIQKMCVSSTRALDVAKGNATPGSVEDRILGGLKVSITIACQGLRAAVDVGSLFTKLTPLDAACLALSLADDGVSTLTGETLAQQLCKIFTTDQSIGGLLTSATSVQLHVVDTGVEDGDEVELKHNGNIVFSGVVTTAGNTYPVDLAPGLNHFEFKALNEGSLPPNTAQVSVLGVNDANFGNTSFNLSTGQVATLDIVRQ